MQVANRSIPRLFAGLRGSWGVGVMCFQQRQLLPRGFAVLHVWVTVWVSVGRAGITVAVTPQWSTVITVIMT